MALMNCPECGREISDAAENCPHCGYPIARKSEPQETEEKNGAAKNTKTKTLLLVIAVAALAITGILTANYIRSVSEQKRAERERAEYIQKLSTIRGDMLHTGAMAEGTASLVKKVWYNTIEKKNDAETNKYTAKPSSADKVYLFKNDFNDYFLESLEILYKSEAYQTSVKEINEGREAIEKTFREMQNPPSDLRVCWEELDELYDNFATLCDCAVKPDGSLLTYSEKLLNADSDFMEHYKKLGAIIPSE